MSSIMGFMKGADYTFSSFFDISYGHGSITPLIELLVYARSQQFYTFSLASGNTHMPLIIH